MYSSPPPGSPGYRLQNHGMRPPPCPRHWRRPRRPRERRGGGGGGLGFGTWHSIETRDRDPGTQVLAPADADNRLRSEMQHRAPAFYIRYIIVHGTYCCLLLVAIATHVSQHAHVTYVTHRHTPPASRKAFRDCLNTLQSVGHLALRWPLGASAL
jgi:hypothetical protein